MSTPSHAIEVSIEIASVCADGASCGRPGASGEGVEARQGQPDGADSRLPAPDRVAARDGGRSLRQGARDPGAHDRTQPTPQRGARGEQGAGIFYTLFKIN